jgi:hypothetical protein
MLGCRSFVSVSVEIFSLERSGLNQSPNLNRISTPRAANFQTAMDRKSSAEDARAELARHCAVDNPAARFGFAAIRTAVAMHSMPAAKF